MHLAFAVFACTSMIGAYAALARLAPEPRGLAPVLALGFIAGCALALALT
ncbi:hypothetical protein AB4225_06195 [Streptomyces sp. 2RAF24]